MYQALLVRKYLTSKVMPLLAAVAVALCSAMVLVVWSVMGGFLAMLIGSGRTLTGDVLISWPNIGFAHYEDLIRRLEADPEIAAAAPMIQTFGLLALPNGQRVNVVVRGVDGPSFSRVTRFDDTLWWRPIDAPLPRDDTREDPRLGPIGGTSWAQVLEHGRRLERPDPRTGQPVPAAVLGVQVSDANARLASGVYVPKVLRRTLADGSTEEVDSFLPRDGEVTLTVPRLDSQGRPVEPSTRILPVANEFQSGLFEIDDQVVLVRIDALQDMLLMDAGRRVVRDGPSVPVADGSGSPEEGFALGGGGGAGERVVEDPARVTHVLVRGRGEEISSEELEALRERVEGIYAEFAGQHLGAVPDRWSIQIFTWEDQNRTMINAVRKETGLLLVLFMIISLVAVFLILAIFYSMISEKTRDIGVLRAVGASRFGIAGLWVAYGLALGVVGAAAGVGLAHLIVWNINPIHEWLGRALGLVIWDPSIYYFSEIPREVRPDRAAGVFIVGVFSAVMGAAYPAVRAACLRPVQALRFE